MDQVATLIFRFWGDWFSIWKMLKLKQILLQKSLQIDITMNVNSRF